MRAKYRIKMNDRWKRGSYTSLFVAVSISLILHDYLKLFLDNTEVSDSDTFACSRRMFGTPSNKKLRDPHCQVRASQQQQRCDGARC